MKKKLKENQRAKVADKQKKLGERWDKYYQSPKWKKLRSAKMADNPLCEVCEIDERYVPATECHHLHIIGSGKDDNERMRLLLDYNNLCSCCHKHHQLFHEYLRLNRLNECTIKDVYDYEKKLQFINQSFD